MLFGTGGVAKHWINCSELIHRTAEKAVYNAVWDGNPAIVKCYTPSRLPRFVKTIGSQPGLKLTKMQLCNGGEYLRETLPTAPGWFWVLLIFFGAWGNRLLLAVPCGVYINRQQSPRQPPQHTMEPDIGHRKAACEMAA